MSQIEVKHETDFVLPASIVSKLDISHLVNEFEKIDNDLTSVAVRSKVGVTNQDKLTASQQMIDFMNANQLKVGDSTQRTELASRLRRLKDVAPVIHITFAAEPDQDSLQNLAAWLRKSVHPQAVIAVGLQPSLIGGVYLRTTNQVHDLSMRAQLAGARDLLIKEVEALGAAR